jgi:Cytochrome c oxidase subunit IV
VKTEGYIFGGGVIFFGLITPIYWFLSEDPTGTTALAISFGLAFLISFYALYTARRLPGPRPEDRVDAEISEGAGTLGFFSPHSWWPLFTALSAAIVALGVVLGWWLAIIGAFFLAVSVVGLVFEYYRGVAADQER